MLKISIAFLYCLVSTIASAQAGSEFRPVSKTVICGPVDSILATLQDKDVDERPYWVGKDISENSDFAVFVNEKTGEFTILQFNRDVACIIGMGIKSQTFNLPKSSSFNPVY